MDPACGADFKDNGTKDGIDDVSRRREQARRGRHRPDAVASA